MVLSIAAIILIIAIDQLTKKLAVLYLFPDKTFPIIKDVLHMTYVENDGASFSILKGQRWFLIAFTGIAMIAITYYLVKKNPKNILERISIVMIMGGGLGNFIDRVRQGYVVDMVDFRAINYAIFNVADSFVVVGVILWSVYFLFVEYRQTHEEKIRNEQDLD